MIQNYHEGLHYLLSLVGRGVQPGLDRVQLGLQLIGNPQNAFPSIIVGGTNGKGSVSTLIARIAEKQGLSVGLFTSPHLHRFTERIGLNGKQVGRREFVSALRRVVQAVEILNGPELTFFETLTLVAAEIFSRNKVDLAVLEVGMGGRLDATNIFPGKVIVITNVAMDHERFLGNSLKSIAQEKLALARNGAHLVVGDLDQSLSVLVDERAKETGATLFRPFMDYNWTVNASHRLNYSGPGLKLENLPLPLRGSHQAHNVAVALTAIAALKEKGFEFGEEAIGKAVRGMKWPARMELICQGKVLLDVAHNPAGMHALCGEIPKIFPEAHPIIFVLGCMKDKDINGIIEPVKTCASNILLVAPQMPRALSPNDFPSWLEAMPQPSVKHGVDEALKLVGPKGLVVVTGSTFVIAEARAYLLNIKNIDPSVPM